MIALLQLVVVLAGTTPPSVLETTFRQVAPAFRDPTSVRRSAGQYRAVVLVHGLLLHPFSQANVVRAHLHSWQRPGSSLVNRLARVADVFGYGYGENTTIDEIAASCDLPRHIERLREAGYQEIVLVGHSAGGLLVRQLVEDNPTLGVTRVIQVCAPNGGSGWAELETVRSAQVEFLRSLTKEARRSEMRARASKRIPEGMELVCVVGTATVVGDGLVSCRCQWTEDLQEQGVPAYPLSANHWSVVRSARATELLARLVREPQPRWGPTQVAATRKRLLRD